MNSDSSTTKILTDIYEEKQAANDSRFAITDFQSRVGEVKYLDEVRVSEAPKKVQNEDLNFNLFGGAAKKKATSGRDNEQKDIYPSLNDIPDKSIKEFLNVCHIDYITSNHKSNSIFVVPDTKALDAIKADINKTLGKTKPESAEGVIKIKTAKLLYKLFILDVFGKNENNGFQYRIPTTYPKEFDDSVIYRRTSHYDDKAFYIQLTKKGCKVSNESDMSNPITLEFVDVIGRYPNYISFVFKGNLLPLMNPAKEMAGGKISKKKKSTKRRFNELMKANEYDNEAGAYQFVGEMINAYGVEKCKPYYSANMLQSAFELISAMGETSACGEGCGDVDAAHMSMMKSYKPKVRAFITSQNIQKLADYGHKYANNMVGYLNDNDYAKAQSYTSDRYFKQIKNAYQQIASDIKSDSEMNNKIAADVAYGIYENTNNVDLAIDMLNATKSCLNGGKKMSNVQLSSAINVMSDYAFHGFNAAQYIPLVNLSKSKSKVVEMKGGDVDELELKLDEGDGECTCGECPDCKAKKAMADEPTTIDDMEKLDELI